jgi:integrase/recombinase XerD
MNTLRQAVQEYLTMRRSLGFKLRDAGKLLLAFVKFMEQCRASYITTKLALAVVYDPGLTIACSDY